MPRKKILLVDDSNTVLMMERMVLSRGPYDFVTARNGEEAVTTALMEQPDLILLDVMMPKMDGFEALRRIRAQEQTKDTPVIMVTTRGEADNIETGFKAGCNDYVTKPIDNVMLLSKIQNLIGE